MTWMAPVWGAQTASASTRFRDALVDAFLTLRAGAVRPQPNATLHLWTDRQNDLPLHYPLTVKNVGDVELSKTVVDSGAISVHHLGELHKMVGLEKDDEVRRALSDLLTHPANVNIGFRSDVIRLVYLCLCTRHGAAQAGGAHLNVHIDADLWRTMNPSGAGSARLSSIDRWDTASRTFALGDTLRRLGYFTRQGENDAMAFIPGHPAAIGTVRKMADTTRNGRFTPVPGEPQGVVVRSGAHDNFHVETQKAARFLARLTGRGQSDTSMPQDMVIDHFRLAESIRQATPQLQYALDRLLEGSAGSSAGHDKESVLKCAAAVQVIYGQCSRLIDNFVNLNSFVPLVATAQVPDKEMAKFFKNVVGAIPGLSSTAKSWRSGQLDTRGKSLPLHDVDHAASRMAFDVIKNEALRSLTDVDVPSRA